MQKNQTVITEITDIGVNGEGIGKVDGYTLFIKDAVIGDQVEVKVRLRKTDENSEPFSGPGKCPMCLCKTVRRLPDPGNVL